MNFSSSLMAGMGISLGGLEIATDYLFANTEMYEPELAEVKSSSNKPQNTFKKVKTVKPKVTKEVIINKFDIIKEKPVMISDEVIMESLIVDSVDDFDFSFDDELKTKDEILKEIDEVEDEASEILEANSLMQRLSSFEGNVIDNENEEDIYEDDEDAFDLEIEDDEIDIDNDEVEVLDEEKEVSDDSFELDIEETDEDAFDLGIEEEDDSEDTINQNTESFNDDFDIEDEDEDTSIDLDEESFDIDDDSFDLDDDTDEEIEDTFDLDEDTKIESVQPINNVVQNKENAIKQENITNKASDNTKDREIEQLKMQVASLNKEMQKIVSDNASKNTSKLKDSNYIDDFDKLVSNEKPELKQAPTSKYDKYTVMTSDELYKYVRQFMIKMGVNKRPVDLSVLNSEFGDKNIKKLINKSYLIKIGKGVTTGR